MTETQAKSGAAGAPTNPGEDAAEGGAPATGRAAVGRATVHPDHPSPKFTRVPGITPPPETPAAGAGAAKPAVGRPSAGKAPVTGAPSTPATTAIPVSSGVTGTMVGSAATVPRTVSAPPVTPAPAPASAPPGIGAAGAARGVGAAGAARVTEAVRAARATVSAAARGPRRARLTLKRIDPWSMMKFSFAVSLVLFIVTIVATSVLYLALDAMGVFKSVNDSLADMVNAGGNSTEETFRITAKGVIGFVALLGAVNVVLFTALATLGAFIYNVCADLVGGIELTLSERD